MVKKQFGKRIHGELEDDDGVFVSSTPALKAPVNEDREDECEFSKECIISVSGAELEYRQIRCCRVQESPHSCPPSSWKDAYRLCEIRKKNLGIIGFYRDLGADARRRGDLVALPFGGHV
ncbi:MAG: hypothetical protein PHI16_03925 [Methanocellales archaeon]|nr:hypothetical protein [Methanocellales archaeon]